MNKKIIYLQTILVVISFLCCHKGLAQIKQQPAAARDTIIHKHIQVLRQQLDLTATQSDALEKLHLDFLVGMDTLRKGPKEEQRRRFDQLIAEQENGLRSILTDEQYKKLKQRQAAAHEANVKMLQQQQAKRNAVTPGKPVNQ
jgi:hypothetical protein